MNDAITLRNFRSKHTPIMANESHGGIQLIFRFANGYGASLIRHYGSYGNEIAVIDWESDDLTEWGICYDTPITDAVLGYLTLERIEETLDKIAELPPRRRELGA